MEELFGFLFSAGIVIGLTVAVANWGRSVGLRWGQVLLVGIALSPVISALIVFVYSATKKLRLAFLK